MGLGGHEVRCCIAQPGIANSRANLHGNGISCLCGRLWRLVRRRRRRRHLYPAPDSRHAGDRNQAEPMKAILRSGFLALAIMALAVPANAGPFEDGGAADV